MNTLGSSSFLRKQVVALSRELGFDICRFAPAERPEHAHAFREWLDQGAGGEMTYLSRNTEKRCDPEQVLPGAKSVIVLALNYFQGDRVEAVPQAGRWRAVGEHVAQVAAAPGADDRHSKATVFSRFSSASMSVPS